MTEIAKRETRIVKGYPEIEIAILFGSAARGDLSPHSDIDIAVGFSVHSTTAQRTALLGQIVQGGVRLVGDSDLFARHLLRHGFDQADFQPLRDRIHAEQLFASTDSR